MANPNPARITDELWRLRTACLQLEPGSSDQDSGIYADKPGYHNTRSQNDPDNYSVRDAPDKYGPGDKAAGWDWTFTTAQGGDYSRIALYGKRMLTAWETRDPRANVLREWLGQTDTDATPEGLDFRYHTKRTPDDSHRWHIHKSIVRAYVGVPGALEGIISIYMGESLDEYLARGGKLYKIDGTGEIEVSGMEQTDLLKYPTTNNPNRKVGQVYTDLSELRDWFLTAEGAPTALSVPANSYLGALVGRVEKLEGWAADTSAQLKRIEDAITALASGGLPPADLSDITESIDQVRSEVEQLTAATKAGAEAVTAGLS